MTPAQRLARYASAWARFGEIRRLSRETHTVDEIVDTVFSFSRGFFEPIQIKTEIVQALKALRALEPRFIVEIGTCGGGTLILWSRIAHPEATIVTIDLPGGSFGGGSSYARVPLLRRCGLPRQTIRIVRADSHRAETLDVVKACLRGNAVDFLFIDADHTERGVRADFADYSPLVRPGGAIAFHDIAIDRPEYGVGRLWRELSTRHDTREFLGSPLSYGIGLLYTPSVLCSRI